MTKFLKPFVAIALMTFVATWVTVVAACGTKLPPNTSVEAKFAVRGNQVVQALRASIPELKKLTCTAPTPAGVVPTCVPPVTMEKVAMLMVQAGSTSEQLAQVLAAVDVAKDTAGRETGLAKAREFIKSIQQSITFAQIAPEHENARSAVVAILGSITALLLTIGL